MHMRALIWVAFFAIFVTSGAASEIVLTTDGRQILLRQDGTYEVIQAAKSEEADGYRKIAISDLKLDIAELSGARIEVEAELTSMGGMVMLSDPRQQFDMNPIMADETNLSREDRAHIINRCTPSCRVTARGEIGMVLFQPGLRLHRLVR